MKKLISLLLVSVFFLSNTAQAQNSGYYVSGHAGASLLSDAKLETNNLEFGEFRFDPGFNVGGALGYAFGNFRLEGEIGYHRNEIDELFENALVMTCPCVSSINGSLSALSYMVNGYYDFHLANSNFTPYIGAGVGASTVKVDIGLSGDETDIVFAYQFAGGIGYKINPKFTLTAGYRYFATTESEFVITGLLGPGASTVFTEVESHEFEVGLRYQF